MLIDSHCHLDRLDLEVQEGGFASFMDACRTSGIGRLLCVGIDLESYPAMRLLVDPYPEIDVAVGVHPNAERGEEPTLARLMALAADPRVVAIGETGLDYYRLAGDAGVQQGRFRVQIAAARACHKPLIIHTRQAQADTLRILKEEGADAIGGVLHCFTEDWEMARAGLDLGFYISFSGIITFKNADDLRSVARRVPLDRLLIETDAPYLAPVPHRGRPNSPLYLRHIADCLAGLRGMAVEALAEQTTENYRSLFQREA
ncbi:TatD family hydrolase [Caldichromatium japonicum]|uniref:TatD family hydrolase n=1 Tax=Caldichromatium japonicum TaxID=2699430 RepID=A0A6G7VGP8_9GAMM|nr:TatD family hydrolase [Caldichromatium japonicum]QIK39191.1 TatD family hydrolase [Caldichromatium japonicum]